MKILKNLDDEILELIPEDEVETLTNEIDKSCQFSNEINDILAKIESIFSKSNAENSFAHTSSTTNFSLSPNPNDSHAKLPNLLSTNLMERYYHGKDFGISIL